MNINDELMYKRAELSELRNALSKLRKQAHISSFTHSNHSASYQEIEQLVKDESRLLKEIQQLEQIEAGKAGKRMPFAGSIGIR